MALCQHILAAMTETPTRDQNKFIVRMPDGMRDRIRDSAAANNRSMNAEIVARLERTFRDDEDALPEISKEDSDRLMRMFIKTMATAIRENKKSKGEDAEK